MGSDFLVGMARLRMADVNRLSPCPAAAKDCVCSSISEGKGCTLVLSSAAPWKSISNPGSTAQLVLGSCH